MINILKGSLSATFNDVPELIVKHCKLERDLFLVQHNYLLIIGGNYITLHRYSNNNYMFRLLTLAIIRLYYQPQLYINAFQFRAECSVVWGGGYEISFVPEFWGKYMGVCMYLCNVIHFPPIINKQLCSNQNKFLSNLVIQHNGDAEPYDQ